MCNEKQITEEQELKNDAFMGKKLYSIRAKFYDRYNVRRDIDYDIEVLIFNKLEELTQELQSYKQSIESAKGELPDIAKIMEGENLFGGKNKEAVADKIKDRIAPILAKAKLKIEELEERLKEAIKFADRKGRRFNKLNTVKNLEKERLFDELQSLKDKLTVENAENLLEKKFNHLFSPEENYLGRLLLAQALIKELELNK